MLRVVAQEFEEYKKYPEYQRLHAGKMEIDEILGCIPSHCCLCLHVCVSATTVLLLLSSSFKMRERRTQGRAGGMGETGTTKDARQMPVKPVGDTPPHTCQVI